MSPPPKQLVLKPQDLIVTLKVAMNAHRSFLLIELAHELSMAVSAVHGSISRAEKSRLLSRSAGGIRHIPSAVREFVLHGARYCYPAELGTLTRGIPTSIASPALRDHFLESEVLPPVWPHATGTAYGPSLIPLHPSVPVACANDAKLYEILTLLDALRVGAARERELSHAVILERL